MKLRVRYQDLRAAAAKLAEAAKLAAPDNFWERHYSEINREQLLLYVKNERLRLRVCDPNTQTQLFLTLKTELLEQSSPRMLTVWLQPFQEQLDSLSSAQFVTLSTDDTDFIRHLDHDEELPRRNPKLRELHLKGSSESVSLRYSEPYFLGSAKVAVRHHLLLSERRLKYLLEHSLFCCNEGDYREYYRGVQFKVSQSQPHLLRCNAACGRSLAALDVKLQVPDDATEDLQALLGSRSARQLLLLLNEKSDELVTLEFSATAFCARLPDCLFKTRTGESDSPDLRAAIPVTDSELTADLKMLLKSLERVQQLSRYHGNRLQLIFAAAEDLTDDGTDLTERALRRHRLVKPTGQALPKTAVKKNLKRTAAATASSPQGACAFGCLFLQYVNSVGENARLKVEGSAYRGSTCRLLLNPYGLNEILHSLSECEQVRLSFERQSRKAVVFTPAAPVPDLPAALTYTLACLH